MADVKVTKEAYGTKIVGKAGTIVLFDSKVAPKPGAKATIKWNASIHMKNGLEFRVPVKQLTESGEVFFGSSSQNGKRVIAEDYDKEKGISYPRVAIRYNDYEELIEMIKAAL